MKNKKYQILLITFLCISFIISTILLIKTIIAVTSFDSTSILDGIMYIICYILLLAFNGLQIVNTIISIKNGGIFLKNLVYDEKHNLNRAIIYFIGGLQLFLLVAVIYFGLITVNVNLPYGSIDIEIVNFIFSFTLLCYIDAIAVLTYPIVDKKMNTKN